MPKFKGFTLIELLVVISILAILSVIGLTIFSGAQRNARDGKRREDVNAIAKALEAHYNDVNTPCNASPSAPYCATVSGSFFVDGIPPDDPIPGRDYNINIPAARTSYTVCAQLENNNGNSSSAGDGTTFTAASGATATFYCKKAQQ